MSDVTRVLIAIGQGDAHAAGQLLPLVYDELRRLAAQRLSHESPGQTLQATALVHEAYLRLVDVEADKLQQWNGRGHFFAAAAEAMRRILIENARRKRRPKHGGDRRRLDFDPFDFAELNLVQRGGGDSAASADDLIALDEALTRLEAEEPGAAAVVKLRYFAGLSIDQAADALGVSIRTANGHWAYAKAWLYHQLTGQGDTDG